MTCSEFIEGFSDYVDEAGNASVLAAAREHAASCESCARYEAVYRRGVTLLRSFPEVAVSEGFEPDLEVRLKRDTAEALRWLGHRPPSSGTAMAVVLGMAVILIGAAWSPFFFLRTTQVELAPIVAATPTRGLAVRFPDIELLPARAPGGSLTADRLWEEPSALFQQYAPVMRGYQTAAGARLGLD